MPTLPGASPEEVTAFMLRLDDVRRQALAASYSINAAMDETSAIKDTLLRSQAPQGLRASAHDIERRLHGLDLRLSGDSEQSKMGATGPLSVSDRLGPVMTGVMFSAYGSTPNLEKQPGHRRAGFCRRAAGTGADSEKRKLPALRAELDQAGVPWTPGR